MKITTVIVIVIVIIIDIAIVIVIDSYSHCYCYCYCHSHCDCYRIYYCYRVIAMATKRGIYCNDITQCRVPNSKVKSSVYVYVCVCVTALFVNVKINQALIINQLRTQNGVRLCNSCCAECIDAIGTEHHHVVHSLRESGVILLNPSKQWYEY